MLACPVAFLIDFYEERILSRPKDYTYSEAQRILCVKQL